MEIKKKVIATRENDRTVLMIQNDGHCCTCPLKQPIPVQNQFGAMNFIEHNCSSKCIGFQLSGNKDEAYFSCLFSAKGSIKVEIETGINEIESSSPLKLIQ